MVMFIGVEGTAAFAGGCIGGINGLGGGAGAETSNGVFGGWSRAGGGGRGGAGPLPIQGFGIHPLGGAASGSSFTSTYCF